MNFFLGLTLAIFIVGCGVDHTDDKSTAMYADTDSGDTKDIPIQPEKPAPINRVLHGYISGAFEVTVDGTSYADSEDFYTEKLGDLQVQAADAGYAGWSLDFDAEIGLSDLKRGLHVFAVGNGSNSFASETTVNSNDGAFTVRIPSHVDDSVIKIRAVKRISVRLVPPTNDEKPVVWCYTYSADEANVNLSETQSIVISTFRTILTKYKCRAGSGGIEIPAPDGDRQDAKAVSGSEAPALTTEESGHHEEGP